MKKIILLVGILALFFPTTQAADWIDVTDQYIINPDYTENSNAGWVMEAWAGSTTCNYQCQEFWQGVWNFYQTVNEIPNGHYRIRVFGYHRPGANSNSEVENYNNGEGTEITSFLYANNSQKPLTCIYANSLQDNLNNGCWAYTTGSGWNRTSVYYPNTMQTASYCFSQGWYPNVLEFDITERTLTFGIRNDEYVASNWTIFTGWRLEYYGEITPISSITLNTTRQTLIIGEGLQLTATITPTDATVRKLTWKSSNTSVANVDNNGLVTALKKGTATISCTATDGSNTKGTCFITVTDNGTRLSEISINEIQSANLDQTVDPSWNYGGWVEFYNPASLAVNLQGCWVSDDSENLQKVHLSQPIVIPAKGFKNLWFDHHDKYCLTQVDLKLDVEGGTFYLSDEKGKLLLSQDYPPAVSRCSYARKQVNADEWGWSSTPTPETANDGITNTEIRLPAPEIDQPTQIFGSTLTVCVNIPEGTTLRYTTDGSAPTATNGMTSKDGLFYPSETTTYRFCLIADGMLPSPVVTRTYIYEDKAFDLPVLSVVGNDKDLYGDEMGVFVRGVNGRPGNGQSTACNWNMDWERPVNFEFLNLEGEMVVNQETAMERCGGWSRAWTPYSFKIKANKLYELQNYLPYQFFSEKPYLKHKTLQIRNGGNDTSCRIKDPALQEIVFRSGLDVDCQAYQPIMHYINGRYAGVINMREPNNKHFVYANYGLDDDEIDQFEMSPDSGYIQKCGTYESMQRWYDLSSLCGSDDEAYEQIKQMVDIDEYCNYMAVEFYLGGNDWPQNNVKGFKPILEGGKFRFVLFDLDGTFATTNSFNNFAGKKTYTFDKLYGEPISTITKEIEFVTIFLNMIKNEQFRKQFIDTYCLVAGSVFEPERCKEIINELANRVSDSQNIWNEVYWTSSTPWNTANDLISKLSNSRQGTMINTLKSYGAFNLSNQSGQNIQLSANIPEARLLVNNLPVPTNKFNGTLFAPVTLKSQAPAGYQFVGWKLVEGTSTNATTILPNESTWLYYDQGSLDGENWTQTGYNTSKWKNGKAPLGYFVGGNRYHNTLLEYGGSNNNKYPTYYFRYNLTLNEAPKSNDVFTLNYTIDDGLIIYVNGTEAGRYNMPDGTATFNTFATTYAHNNPDSGTLILDASLFKQGSNVIAVEIHNNAANSTDIYWEASITHSSEEEQGGIVSTEEVFEMPAGNMVLQACYAEMTEKEKEEAEIATTPIVINEISAGNSIYVNEYFKKDDWVELYNTTSEDIDLEGMFLTDRSDKPTKYQITAKGTKASTIIPAHGYKIIWCSKRESNTELHANFKLDNEDGTVIRLMAADQSWADSLVYCAHNGDQTVGRYPDGGQQVYLMTQPTIAKSNLLNTYATAWEYVAPDTVETHIKGTTSRSGSMSIAYAGQQLLIKSEESSYVTISIYTPTGALQMTQPLNLENGHERISVANLPTGIYVARARDNEGNECSTKFLKQ